MCEEYLAVEHGLSGLGNSRCQKDFIILTWFDVLMCHDVLISALSDLAMTSQTYTPVASSSAGGGCYCSHQLVLLLLLDIMDSAGLLAPEVP